jgi:hypothetical protein
MRHSPGGLALPRRRQGEGDDLGLRIPRGGRLEAQIGRLEMDFSYDAKAKTISGTGVLHFVPLAADPMQPSEL